LVLLIGETIGWQELIFIGILALIFLGPKKIPDLARTIGKYMAEFRRATSEFKSTWEEEVSHIKDEFMDMDKDMRMLALLETPKPVENSIGRNQSFEEENKISANGNNVGSNGDQAGNQAGNELEMPVVKQIEPSEMDIKGSFPVEMTAETGETAEPAAEKIAETKKDWL
jgi:Tat protein translocase TatB subunit